MTTGNQSTPLFNAIGAARPVPSPRNRQFVLVFIALPLLVVCASGCAPPTVAQGLGWIRGYLLGKVADGIWDEVFGKPDTVELDRRLRQLEEDLLGIQTRFGTPIRTLRTKIKRDTTRNDYFAMATEAGDQIEELEHRVKDLESQLKRQSQELERQRTIASARIDNVGMAMEPIPQPSPASTSSSRRTNQNARRQDAVFVGTPAAQPHSPHPQVEISLRTWDWNGGDRFSAPDDRGLTVRWRLQSGSPIEPLPSGDYPRRLKGAFMRDRGKITFHTGDSVFTY